MFKSPEIYPVNENTLIIYFSDEIDTRLPQRIAGVVGQIKKLSGNLIVDLTPSYTSLLISYDLTRIDYPGMEKKLADILKSAKQINFSHQGKLIEIPVYYSPESGLDLQQTADKTGLSIEQVIKLHSDPEYLVFALGFMPGFAFMGIVDKPLRLPRLDTPRKVVPAGSVAITEKQTAVYPAETPGGWRLLGRSPVRMFDPELTPPQPYQIGDRVKFIPISKSEYIALGGRL